MNWQPPAPVSHNYRYTVLTLILAFTAFFVVVTFFAVVFAGMSTTTTS